MTNDLRPKAGATPFPDVVIDKLMPRLRDTEWRLIGVIFRQTHGWRSDDGRHKPTDWLSHSQLRRRTGRSSAAISVAIEFLCRNDLIEVTDSQGQPHMTAYLRRQLRGRLYFRINPAVLSGESIPRRFKSRIQKVGTTTKKKVALVVVRARKPKRESRNDPRQGEWRDWQRVGDLLKGRGNRRGKPSR